MHLLYGVSLLCQVAILWVLSSANVADLRHGNGRIIYLQREWVNRGRTDA
jgi:hypothetical protein